MAVQSDIQKLNFISHQQSLASSNTWNAARTVTSAEHGRPWDCASGAIDSAKHRPTFKKLSITNNTAKATSSNGVTWYIMGCRVKRLSQTAAKRFTELDSSN